MTRRHPMMRVRIDTDGAELEIERRLYRSLLATIEILRIELSRNKYALAWLQLRRDEILAHAADCGVELPEHYDHN